MSIATNICAQRANARRESHWLIREVLDCGGKAMSGDTAFEFAHGFRKSGVAADRFAKWVREWRCRHPLPVVAMESILHIYRRAPFGLRATPARCDALATCSVWTE